MRIEPFGVGSYLHVLKRGARGMPITGDDADCWRFLRLLYYLNEEHFDERWIDERYTQGFLNRPDAWPARTPLVHVVCFTLMPNHVHLILEEIRENGTSTFMRKVGQSMTNHFNEKYKQKGSIFQGAYKSRTIIDNRQMLYTVAYVMVKNTFELYPNGGLRSATENFELAWQWAITYPFSSLIDYCGERNAPIIKRNFLNEIFDTPRQFKIFARDVIMGGKWLQTDFE